MPFPTFALHAAPSSDFILELAKINGGLCVFPRSSSPALAHKLAADDAWIVYAQSADRNAVLQARQAAAKAGLLNGNLYLETGKPNRIPLADQLADLLVVHDLTTADLTTALRAEWLRVLSYRRGTAVLGNSDANKVKAGQLKQWAAAIPTATLHPKNGLWLVFRRPADPKADEWTHRHHAADNNLVSGDRLLKAPFLPQWYHYPLHEGFWGTNTVVGGGRIYTIWAVGLTRVNLDLRVRSLGSGLLLYKRKFKPREYHPKDFNYGIYPGRSCMIATQSGLVLSDHDGVLLVDGETGEDRGRIGGPLKGGQIKWMAVHNGKLLLLAGGNEQFPQGGLQCRVQNAHGRHLAVYDLETGKQLWKIQIPSDVDERRIAAHGDRLVYHAQGKFTRCRKVADGAVVWTNSRPDTVKKIDPGKPTSWHLVSLPALTLTADVAFCHGVWSENDVALDAADGKELWSRPKGGRARSDRILLLDGKLVERRSNLDLRTGKENGAIPYISGGCGPSKASPYYIFAGFGAAVDRATGNVLRDNDVKPPCDTALTIADGLAFSTSSTCICNLQIQGYRSFSSAHDIAPHAALASVGSNPAIAWRWSPPSPLSYSESSTRARRNADYSDQEQIATASIAVADKVFVGGHDGVLRAHAANDGTLLWSYPLSARFFAPPSYWNGRIFAGGSDGWVHCLDAANGKLLWKFRAASADRRIFWYGDLINTWPLVGGVLVHEGVAYCAAGVQQSNGLHVYALNAATGEVIWEEHAAGAGNAQGFSEAYSNFGAMTIAAGRLWLCSETFYPSSFDCKTGSREPAPTPKKRGGTRRTGREILNLADRWVIFGGHRIFTPQELWFVNRKKEGFTAFDTRKQLSAWGVGLVGKSNLPPAYDDKLFLTVRNGTAGLAAWKTQDLLDELKEAASTVDKSSKKFDPLVFPDLIQRKKAEKRNAPKPSRLTEWGPQREDLSSFALAANAVVIARPQVTGKGHRMKTENWQCRALSRKDGSVLWSVILPKQPVGNGLAIARDGSVLLTLRDGGLVSIGDR